MEIILFITFLQGIEPATGFMGWLLEQSSVIVVMGGWIYWLIKDRMSITKKHEDIIKLKDDEISTIRKNHKEEIKQLLDFHKEEVKYLRLDYKKEVDYNKDQDKSNLILLTNMASIMDKIVETQKETNQKIDNNNK